MIEVHVGGLAIDRSGVRLQFSELLRSNHGQVVHRAPMCLFRASTSVKPGFHSNAMRQPIGMLGRSSGNHDWLLANASACVSCGFRLRNARNANDCI